MAEGQEFRLWIDAFSVDTIPMARLAEYMAAFARLLGEQHSVHFEKMEEGSAILVSQVDQPASPKVRERLHRLRSGSAPKDAIEAYKAIDNLLAKDNAIGSVIPPEGANIIEFPGRTRAKPISYGPFRERGSLDGVVLRLGGKDETVPVTLRNGEIEYLCQSSVELSIELSKYYRGLPIRVYGSGKWIRDETKTWTLQRFDIESFDVLDSSSLTDIVTRLQSVEGGAWYDSSLTDILGIRRDPEDQQ